MWMANKIIWWNRYWAVLSTR